MKRWAGPLLLLLVVLLAGLFASLKVYDPDTWWHLAGGREILHGSFPTVNTFSFTHPDAPWDANYWLFEATLYAVHAAGGAAAVNLLQALVVALAFLLAVQAFRIRAGEVDGLDLLLSLPVAALALGSSWFRFHPRPQLATYLGLALLLYLWEKKPRRLPLWFLLTGIAWGNSHAGVAFGGAVCLIILASAVLARRGEARQAALAAGAFLLGSACNPFFIQPYLYSFTHFSIGQVVDLQEFLPPAPKWYPAFFLLAGLAVAAIPLRLGRRDFLYPLLVIAFLVLSLKAVRIIPKFAIVCLPGLLLTLHEARRWPAWKRLRVPAAALALVLVLACAGAAAREMAVKDFPFYFGWGENEVLLPKGAVRVIREKGLEGRGYNDFGQGGYLTWTLFPERRVFQDARVLAYPIGFFSEVSAKMSHASWGPYMDRWGIQYAVVSRETFGGSMDAGVLFEKMKWPLVEIEGVSLLYVRPSSANEARTADLRFDLVGSRTDAPTLFALGKEFPARMAGELRRIDPGRLLAAGDFARFGAAAFGAGDLAAGEAFFRAGLRRHPGNLEMRLNLGTLLVAAGRREEGARELREVARRDPGGRLGTLARQRAEAALPPGNEH